MAQYVKCAQAIQLRTRIMPEVFEGNPTAQSLGSGKAVRYVQWGSDVLAVANFSASDVQSYTVPTGTWYSYYGGQQLTTSTLTLQPGELVILTGRQVTRPTIPTAFSNGIVDVTKEQGRLLSNKDVTVYTLGGQMVMKMKNAQQLNLESLPRGTYVVRMANGKAVKVRK